MCAGFITNGRREKEGQKEKETKRQRAERFTFSCLNCPCAFLVSY